MPPHSPEESTRQRALDTYRIVDTLPEAAFDDIARLASMLCGAPIAAVSLIDRDRQWFKARTGVTEHGSTRADAVCDHAIRTPGALMEVPDLAADARFVSNPFVTGDIGARFYAGMPLVTPSGEAIGTVCVLDRQPRTLDDSQRDALSALARLTMNLLESHKRELALERAALLATPAPPSPAIAQPGAAGRGHFTVAIVELQDFAGSVQRLGERATEKAMHALAVEFEGLLRTEKGDAIDRATGSPEFIVVLQGEDTDAPLQRLREALPAFERETGLCMLLGAAASQAPGEPMGTVFVRADEALSAEKDRRYHAAH